MTKEQLRTVRDANPFRPFTIRMADGRDFRIHHRDFLSVPPDGAGRVAIIYKPGGGMSFVDLLLATELTVEAPESGVNGESSTGH